MKEATINEFLNFFRSLDFKSKVEVLNVFTQELKRGVDEASKNVESGYSESDRVIDELFGIWKDEDGLSEEMIIDRTVSDRAINMD
ncbi:MAG: hypothetical protein GVY26_03290 [Bacteroidetes bacterium]|jgi:hypothetical protein|nr:hypothetical protein [Bacteroidota bacterium]